jgi:hypothetical protein
MDEISTELLSTVREIRDLVRLMAEPAIAERDRDLRVELRRVIGRSVPGAKAVLLMDGTRSQATIQKETRINQGQLSTLVKQLNQCKLLSGDAKEPKIAISIPVNFFEIRENNE